MKSQLAKSYLDSQRKLTSLLQEMNANIPESIDDDALQKRIADVEKEVERKHAALMAEITGQT